MKRILRITVCCLLLLFLGCSRGGQKWICTAAVAPNSGVVRCGGRIRSHTGVLCIRNRAPIGVTVYLYAAEAPGEPAFTMRIGADGVFRQYRVPEDTVYTLGLTASVTVEESITVVVSDGPLTGRVP